MKEILFEDIRKIDFHCLEDKVTQFVHVPSTIRICPFCKELFTTDFCENDFFSGLCMQWTDGSRHIKLSEFLNQCKKCTKYFFTADSKCVGIDDLEGSAEVVDGYYYFFGVKINDKDCVIKVEDYINEPQLKGYKGSSRKYGNTSYIPFDGLPSDYKGADTFFVDSLENIKDALSKNVCSTLNQEFELRLRVWWSSCTEIENDIYNDIYIVDNIRICEESPMMGWVTDLFEPDELTVKNKNSLEYKQSLNKLKNFTHSEAAQNNIQRTLEIMEPALGEKSKFTDYQIIKSDMLRQLGFFDDSIKILADIRSEERYYNSDSNDLTDFYNYTIDLIVQSCRDEIKCKRRIYNKKYLW